MAEEDDLYTDYALQLFSSYLSDDIEMMQSIIQSFKNDENNMDNMFMPGLIYGLMYHMATMLHLISDYSKAPVEKLFTSYAMDYAIAREELLNNPLLNVKKAKETMSKIIEELTMLEDFLKEEE